jgi:hypothetical protein
MSKCSSDCSCKDNCHSDKITRCDIEKIITKINKICKFCSPCEIVSTCIVPTVQASFLGNETLWFDTNTLTWNANINWTRGNGDGVIVVATELPLVTPIVSPSSNTTYTPDYEYGKGQQIGFGQYVVYNGSGTSATVTGLSSDKTYMFVIFEYNSSEFCYKAPGSSYTILTPIPI